MDSGTGPSLPVPQNLLDLINNSVVGFCPAINGQCRIDCIARSHAEYEGIVDEKQQFMSPHCNFFKVRIVLMMEKELAENVRFV
jgi:hypothetical protein